MTAKKKTKKIDGETFINRELSWLQFARRVLELARDPEVPLLERVRYVGILGMLHDEFFMKRMSGLKRQIENGVEKVSIDGRTPEQEYAECRAEIIRQVDELADLMRTQIKPALVDVGFPVLDHDNLSKEQKADVESYFKRAVLPILTPLAVDAEHPFPFISNLGLNLAVVIKEKKRERFIRIKVPANRDRWYVLGDDVGCVPLEQVIAANLGLLFPKAKIVEVYLFRLTRGAEADEDRQRDLVDPGKLTIPGNIVEQVASELKARRFAGEVRLQVSTGMPDEMREWLRGQLGCQSDEVYVTETLLGIADLLRLDVRGRDELRYPVHRPATHPRLRTLDTADPSAIFREICRGDILLHHPYQSFDTSVLRFLESAAKDDRVLAIKLTIYRTSNDSPIIAALVEAARRGKQVAVLVEITARFDEAPNIAWGRRLEEEGVHVSYGVEKLKTHVKLALVVREENDGIRRYVHVGTGNYHTGTARIYEDLGLLSCDPTLSDDVSAVFNELTGATPYENYEKLLVAPRFMRDRFSELISREIEHAEGGRPSGIMAKMNQLQDPSLVRELYEASRAGVPITLNIRGLCILQPGVPGLSDNIRVFSVLGRFLEHGRIYRFANGGDPEVYIGSADWMKRNLDRRVESIAPVTDPELKKEIDEILAVLENDNHTAWDLQPDGSHVRRQPVDGEPVRAAQQEFIRNAAQDSGFGRSGVVDALED
ncbi:MAG: polyphosphate kinase 1 [Holophagae bacterium]|jgi:polyphosphate kinase